MIQGVQVTPLQRIPDERGYVMHFLRRDWPAFKDFGEVYISAVYPGVIKGWHLHRERTLNYAVIKGMAKVVLYDERESETHGETMELFIGEHNYQLVTVPPGIWNGFKGVSSPEALVAVCLDGLYDQAEIVRLDPLDNHIPYDWATKSG